MAKNCDLHNWFFMAWLALRRHVKLNFSWSNKLACILRMSCCLWWSDCFIDLYLQNTLKNQIILFAMRVLEQYVPSFICLQFVCSFPNIRLKKMWICTFPLHYAHYISCRDGTHYFRELFVFFGHCFIKCCEETQKNWWNISHGGLNGCCAHMPVREPPYIAHLQVPAHKCLWLEFKLSNSVWMSREELCANFLLGLMHNAMVFYMHKWAQHVISIWSNVSIILMSIWTKTKLKIIGI